MLLLLFFLLFFNISFQNRIVSKQIVCVYQFQWFFFFWAHAWNFHNKYSRNQTIYFYCYKILFLFVFKLLERGLCIVIFIVVNLMPSGQCSREKKNKTKIMLLSKHSWYLFKMLKKDFSLIWISWSLFLSWAVCWIAVFILRWKWKANQWKMSPKLGNKWQTRTVHTHRANNLIRMCLLLIHGECMIYKTNENSEKKRKTHPV